MRACWGTGTAGDGAQCRRLADQRIDVAGAWQPTRNRSCASCKGAHPEHRQHADPCANFLRSAAGSTQNARTARVM